MAEIPDVVFNAIKASWREPLMRWVLPVGSAVLVLALATDYGTKTPTFGNLLTASAVALLLLALWATTNRVPRIPPGHAGVVVALVGEDEREDQQVKADFVRQLRNLLEPDRHSTRFSLLVLPPHIAANCIDHHSASEILAQVRGHFMIYGTVRRRRIGGEDAHLLAMEGVVRHTAAAEPEIRERISADFRQALPRRVQFPVNNDALAFQATSEWTEVAARYVIGLAAMASGDVWYAETLLLSAEERLKSAAPRFAPLREIARSLPQQFEELYTNWQGALHTAYYLTRRKEFVENAEEVTRKLLARNPDSYAGHLQMAISHFLLRRDLPAARKEIMLCRRVRDVTWRYSRAFLLAYEGDTKRAREEYNEAFQGRIQDVTVPVQVEEFIHLVLDEEPEKIQLHFFLGLINLRAKGDLEAAARDFRAFLDAPASNQFPAERALAERHLAEIGETADIGG